MSAKEDSPLLKDRGVRKDSPGAGAGYDGYEYDKYKTFYISLSLVYSFIVCGLVTVALGAALEDLAGDVGYEATAIGSIYVARGVGSVLGSFLSFYVFEYSNAVRALVANEVLAALVTAAMPFITRLWTLHAAYFMIGCVTSVLQAGSMLLLRKIHKEKAGPWLGAFGASFVSAGIAVPALQLLFPSLTPQFLLIAVLVLCGACWLLTLPPLREDIHSSVEDSQPLPIHQPPEQLIAPHYWAECVVAAMIFLAIGGGDSLTFYLETYVDTTPALEGCNKALLLLFFFVFATVGDVLGILGQMDVSDRVLSLQAGGLFLTGAAGMLLVIIHPHSQIALWIGVCVFGLCNAPSISYCFNLANRLSVPSATSTSIIMLGLSLGVSLLPFFTSVAWRWLDWPQVLMCVGCGSAGLPVLLLGVAPSCSYLKDERAFVTFF